jgi:hypothetical protein
LFAEIETRVEQLKTSETDLKNLFYRVQEARQVLELDYKDLAYECDKHMELRIASDRDLVNCYKSLQEMNEVPLVDRVLVQRLEPCEWSLVQAEGEVEALGVVVAASVLDGEGIAPELLDGVLLRVVLGDPQRFELVGEEQVAKSR